MDKSKNKKPDYWLSIEHYDSGRINPDYRDEFPGAMEESFQLSRMSPVSRRKFLALLGASSAFALASCNDYQDKGEIVAYNNKPEFSTMGEAVYYASTLNDGQGILVKTREGRPIKIDGNPDHPVSKGKLSVQGHAEILNLYDPERITGPLTKSRSELIMDKDEMDKIDWKQVDKEIVELLGDAKDRNMEIAIITGPVLSPAQKKLFMDFKAKYPNAKIYSYDFFDDANRREAWKSCFGNADVPVIRWEQANIILALESDFLGNEGCVTEQARLFASRRDVNNPDGFNRLYCVEGNFSQTGVNADYRLRLDPVFQYEFVLALAAELAKKGVIQADSSFENLSKSVSLKDFATQRGLDYKKLTYLVKDLSVNKGKAIIYAGDKLPVKTHIAVNVLNKLLGNDNLYNSENHQIQLMEPASKADWEALVKNLKAGSVGVLINFDSNPVYHLPKDYGFEEAYKKAGAIISLVEVKSEFTSGSKYILPINHALESWGDFNLRKGIISLQQPVISPVYDTRQKEAALLNWLSEKPEEYTHDIYHQFIMNRWEKEVYPQSGAMAVFRKFWLSCLEEGVLTFSQSMSFNPVEQPDSSAVKAPAPTPVPMPPAAESTTGQAQELCLSMLNGKYTADKKEGFTVILSANYTIGDGRYANNGWLQELPHPVSKVAWDNYAALSPKTAKSLKVENNDVIEIAISSRKIYIPVIVQPGMAEETINIELGYGRTAAGEVGSGVGANANLLLSKEPGISNRIYTGAKVKPTGEIYELASTQEHHAVDDEKIKDFHYKRDIIRDGTVEEYRKHPEFLKHKNHEIISISPDIKYEGVKWAMAVDMNKCINCTNCVISCNVENNIPVVGKEQVGKGREMHWMRIDRYYSGTPEEPKTSVQPMLCSHCDNAPCENVCPVAATNHSPDGLNQMAYNRCVGTRYCANNCPFKVRRFNFFNFRDHFADGYYHKDSLQLLHNPEVTVRSRGVMEKCTFCIQRIMEARQEAIKDGRQLKGGDVKTACQQACPADAIVFGDMNDPESEISKLRAHKLGYSVLELLNIKPNVTYIAKLRNIYTEDV